MCVRPYHCHCSLLPRPCNQSIPGSIKPTLKPTLVKPK